MGVNRIDRGSDFGQPPEAGGRSPRHQSQGADRFDVGSEISDLADLMNRLQELRQSDAARFARVAARIAERLRDAVAAGGSAESAARLADQFQAAALGGALPTLQPGATRPHHGVQGYERQRPSGAGRDAAPEGLARIIQEALGTA